MARVHVVIFASNTMQVFQLLGLTLFGIFTRERKYHLPFEYLGTALNFVDNVSTKMAKTLTMPNVWAAFQAIGVEWRLTWEAFHIMLCCLSRGKVEGVEGIR
jgi:hypothetical protein